MITQQPKVFENPNIVDIKSVFPEYPKSSPQSFKTIGQAENVSQIGSNSCLYSDKKVKII